MAKRQPFRAQFHVAPANEPFAGAQLSISMAH
jgi:hypothetical protein